MIVSSWRARKAQIYLALQSTLNNTWITVVLNEFFYDQAESWGCGPMWSSRVSTAQRAKCWQLARDAFEIIDGSSTQVLFFAALSLWLGQSSKEKVGSALWYTCLGSRSNVNLSRCSKAKQTRGGLLVSKDLNRKIAVKHSVSTSRWVQEMSPFPKEPFEGFFNWIIHTITQMCSAFVDSFWDFVSCMSPSGRVGKPLGKLTPDWWSFSSPSGLTSSWVTTSDNLLYLQDPSSIQPLTLSVVTPDAWSYLDWAIFQMT